MGGLTMLVIPENIRFVTRFMLHHLEQASEAHMPDNELTYRLPALLHNAGVTQTIIPASSIHCTRKNNLLEIQVADAGTFMIDIEKGRLHAFTPLVAETPAGTAFPVNLLKFGAQVTAFQDARKGLHKALNRQEDIAMQHSFIDKNDF